MPYNNGRIYTDQTTSPKTGISTADVDAVLGAGSLDEGTLCTYSGINPYAKYKPVRSSSRTTPSDIQRKVINFGVSAPVPSSTPEATKETSWEYLKPRGGEERYRILDFNEYYHGAVSPITSRGNVTIKESGNAVSLAVYNNVVGSMTLQDYGVLENYYLCVFMVGSGNDHLPYIKTTETTVGESMSPLLTLTYSELTPFDTGTEYYLCLCNTQQTTLGGLPAGAAYLPLPYFNGDTLSNYIGTISKKSGYEVRLVANLVLAGNGIPSSSQFSTTSYPSPPVPNYFSALPSPNPVTGQIENESRYYYNVGNSTSLKIRLTFTAIDDPIYGNYIYANVSPTFYGTPSARQKVTIYEYKNGAVSVVAGALEVGVTYIATLYDDALVLDSSNNRGGAIPSTYIKLKPVTVTFYDGQGEDSIKIGTCSFGLRNQ